MSLLAGVFFYINWQQAELFRTSFHHAQPTYRQITFVGDAAFPALSPDGKSIVYVTGKKEQGQRLMLQDLKGGQAIEISKAPTITNARWSPDGAELAAAVQSDTFLTPRLGGSSRFIAVGTFPSWSPDGTQIATAQVSQIGFTIVDKVTGSAKNIHLSGFRWLLDLDWSPTSNLLAVLTTLNNGRDAIWTVRPDGSRQHKVIEEDVLASPRWSAAGDGIYFLDNSQGHSQELSKVAINPESGRAKDTASVLLSGMQADDYFAVSTDGRCLAYPRSQNYSNLWLAQFQSLDKANELADGVPARPLTTGTARFDSPSLSPDGKWLAFVTQGHIHKLKIEGGKPIQLTFSNATEFSPAWSPDGKRVAFGSNEGGSRKVWITDTDGANRRQFVKTQLTGGITWSPGRDILYQNLVSRARNTFRKSCDLAENQIRIGSPDEGFGIPIASV